MITIEAPGHQSHAPIHHRRLRIHGEGPSRSRLCRVASDALDVDGRRDPFESLKGFLIRAGLLVISWPLRYVAFLLNVPFVVSLVAMIVAIVLVLQEVYGIAVVELTKR